MSLVQFQVFSWLLNSLHDFPPLRTTTNKSLQRSAPIGSHELHMYVHVPPVDFRASFFLCSIFLSSQFGRYDVLLDNSWSYWTDKMVFRNLTSWACVVALTFAYRGFLLCNQSRFIFLCWIRYVPLGDKSQYYWTTAQHTIVRRECVCVALLIVHADILVHPNRDNFCCVPWCLCAPYPRNSAFTRATWYSFAQKKCVAHRNTINPRCFGRVPISVVLKHQKVSCVHGVYQSLKKGGENGYREETLVWAGMCDFAIDVQLSIGKTLRTMCACFQYLDFLHMISSEGSSYEHCVCPYTNSRSFGHNFACLGWLAGWLDAYA